MCHILLRELVCSKNWLQALAGRGMDRSFIPTIYPLVLQLVPLWFGMTRATEAVKRWLTWWPPLTWEPRSTQQRLICAWWLLVAVGCYTVVIYQYLSLLACDEPSSLISLINGYSSWHSLHDNPYAWALNHVRIPHSPPLRWWLVYSICRCLCQVH